ncbi:MAG: LLM class flavin-dependent oxidoreductase, partial [Chloroflexota bacterium]|nr:LLM class flavin-dependent oxidoreductase [Chloroflexota bacterium]
TDSQERFRDTVLAVRDLWCKKGVSIKSPFFSINNADLVPSVLQSPHPPIYIAATRSEETLDFMISNQFLLCIAVVQDTEAALNLVGKYKRLCAEQGQPDRLDEVPFFRYVHVAESGQKALSNTKKHVDWIQDIMQWRRNLTDATEVYLPMQKWIKERNELPPSDSYISEKRAFIGTPEVVAEKIMMLKDHGISYFGCNFAMGGLPQEEIIKSMKLFEKKVLPLIS